MAVVVCLAGSIGSGKTSVAATLASVMNSPRVSFGDYVRQQVELEGGNPLDRLVLQEYGLRRINADADRFCREVFGFGGYSPGRPAVVDGVRHPSVLKIIQALVAPDDIRLIFLAANETLRAQRSAEAGIADSHPVETQIPELAALADLVIDASLPLSDVVQLAVAAIDGWKREPAEL